MELVLSPGRLGGGGNGPGSPFQNQEVREWSHVDRLTGMLEHARIETGRWQTRNQGTAQAYGKVIDSRERNSADGNVVQKARRQVEVFQSQGIGGRSVQVVRASQWSSSRITDSTSSSPVSVSMSDASQLRNGNDDSLQLAKLSQVSRLCRQINAEANDNKRTNYRDKIAPQSVALVNRLNKFESSSTVTKSTSNEDLTKSADPGARSQTVFARDCKARRSLQIPKRIDAPESRRLSPEGTESGPTDRKVVKSYILGMEEAPKNITDKKFLLNGVEESGEYLRPTPIVMKSNKTVVHLNNKLLISSGSENESVSSQDTDSLVKSRVQSLASQFSQSNNYHSFVAKKQVMLDSTSRIESLSNNSGEILSTDDTQSLFFGKPVKKVGFCKTEVHFAAESGKVNIVETDCKPPPSNRFRRRRRSNPVSMNTPSSGLQANKNLPLIHFGDTSYEKYIFGQSIKDKTTATDENDVQHRLQNSSGAEDFVFRDGWGARIKTILQSEPLPIISKEVQPNELVNGATNFDGVIQDETIAVDHTFKGSHTTTVNLGADLISKLQKHRNEDNIDILNSGLPEEEVCFESNKTVESNVVTSDNENNKVLFNIVTTHEPVTARVKDTRPPEARRELFGGKKDKKSDKYNSRDKSVPSVPAKKTSIIQKAKDHCDNKSGKDEDAIDSIDPTYVNVFEGSVGSEAESIPIYENCRIAIDTKYRKSNHVDKVIKSLAELNSVTDAIVKSAKNGHCESDSSLSNTDCDEDAFKRSYSKDLKLSTISENRLSARIIRESQKVKPSRTRGKKTLVRSPSSASSMESIHRTSANEGTKDSDKPLHAKSTRSSRLHRATNGHESSSKETIERYSSNEKKKKTTIDKPRANHAVDPTGTKKSLNDSTKSKKPIEIVYQTAVFNMKNEKLAGKSRSKESKAPRYINDLICGSSKPKRSTDVRHARGSALSQQRVHHKSASPTNRHWK